MGYASGGGTGGKRGDRSGTVVGLVAAPGSAGRRHYRCSPLFPDATATTTGERGERGAALERGEATDGERGDAATIAHCPSGSARLARGEGEATAGDGKSRRGERRGVALIEEGWIWPPLSGAAAPCSAAASRCRCRCRCRFGGGDEGWI